MKFPSASPSLSFSEATNRAVNNLLNINGRSRRSEFWWTMLVVAISYVIPCISNIVLLLAMPLAIRRLHDTGRSGWWIAADAIMTIALVIAYFIITVYSSSTTNILDIFCFALFIYKIAIIAFCCMDSQPYPNQYGESPKYNAYDIDDNNNNNVNNNSNIKFR
ncbi:MAG: DUF805 domain-containing protein [Bacteroidaceae bacterium]|nr:DUF805 domain-containing protein [Bacteroidaceae bacterium]